MPTVTPDRISPPSVIIRVDGLTVQFGEEKAVNNLTFDFQAGKIFGFIGPSGSGKTSLVRLLTGFYKPTSGFVEVLGYQPSHFPKYIRQKIGYMPQLFALYPELTVWENMNFCASIYGMPWHRTERLTELLHFVDLADHQKKLARNLSGGMKRRLSLAATLVHRPSLLFLDEPTAGIDPVLRRRMWDYFKNLQAQGNSLFITTQYVGEAAYCDCVGVMANGQLLMVDTPQNLRQRAFGGQIIDLYTKEDLLHKDLTALSNLPFVQNRVTYLHQQHNAVRLVVDRANTAIPTLLEWCRTEYVNVESIEEYLPPFDDVFVELVKGQT